MHFFGDFEHVFWRSSLYSLEKFTNFCGGSEAVRHLGITVSVTCLSVRPPVRPSVWASACLSHFSSDYNFATVHVSHCIPCDMTFTWDHNFWPRDLHLQLWPAFVKSLPSFSYIGQENPTGSVVLDFSVWYCLSGTELPVCYFYAYLQGRGTRKIIYYLLFDLDRFISVSGGLL